MESEIRARVQKLKAEIEKSYEAVTKGIQCPHAGCNGIINQIDGDDACLHWTRNDDGVWFLSISEPGWWLMHCSADKNHVMEFSHEDIPIDLRRFLRCGAIQYKPGQHADVARPKSKRH